MKQCPVCLKKCKNNKDKLRVAYLVQQPTCCEDYDMLWCEKCKKAVEFIERKKFN
jgi:hypothetical protein